VTEAERITRALPKGKWYRTYGSARCPAHGDVHPSLTLANAPDGKLLLHCKAGCGFSEVLDALRLLGLVEAAGSRPTTDLAELARAREAERLDADKRAGQAAACWNEALPIVGTIAETYLRRRGTTCPLPSTLRFHPSCWHPSAKRLPAMVALVERAERVAIHRTYLRADGSGKAQADPAKAMLGSVAGGAVRLSQAAGPLVVAEGIETALSLLSGLLPGAATVWATLSTSGMQGLSLPRLPGRLKVASDGDDAGRAAAHTLATRASGLGWTVSLLPAPDGRDWNDILMMKKGAAA
jgi:hypothetical protein